MDLRCLCSFIGGVINPEKICILGNEYPLKRAVRKEYRQLSDDERERFHAVLQKLKNLGIFEGFNKQHKLAAPGSHLGPAFLPWHREFLKRFEIAIRMMDPSLAIPYWDSTMDFHLPEPKDSILWSSAFLGESDSDGMVVTGQFAGWKTLEGRDNIKRRLGFEGRPFNESDLWYVFAQKDVKNILAYTDLKERKKDCPIPLNYVALEFFHANVHFFVGGDMKPPETAGNDPTFYLLHSFVDYIWEIWRVSRQTREAREKEYTPDFHECGHPLHFGNSIMHPFEILANKDGLSNAYIDE
uniref:Tyrosinase copper-binding domain-containing protein n=1 Tax=Panagrolaimus sp. ES5 TaxID=591445 RepID=A0AC34F8Y4_9BILA